MDRSHFNFFYLYFSHGILPTGIWQFYGMTPGGIQVSNNLSLWTRCVHIQKRFCLTMSLDFHFPVKPKTLFKIKYRFFLNYKISNNQQYSFDINDHTIPSVLNMFYKHMLNVCYFFLYQFLVVVVVNPIQCGTNINFLDEWISVTVTIDIGRMNIQIYLAW